MSYLTLPQLPEFPDFTKAVISFWFRVPQETVDKVTALQLPSDGFFEPNTWPVLQKIATLLSWDKPQVRGTIWHWTEQPVGTTYDVEGAFVQTNYSLIPTDQQTGSMAPSYIGLDFTGYDPVRGQDAAPVRITVNIQSSNKPD